MGKAHNKKDQTACVTRATSGMTIFNDDDESLSPSNSNQPINFGIVDYFEHIFRCRAVQRRIQYMRFPFRQHENVLDVRRSTCIIFCRSRLVGRILRKSMEYHLNAIEAGFHAVDRTLAELFYQPLDVVQGCLTRYGEGLCRTTRSKTTHRGIIRVRNLRNLMYAT